ncbi:MAG: SRPBCC domain-containing protein [bacterium]
MVKPYGHDIKQRTFIAAPIERVFATITSADGWDAFFTTGMELEPTPGGRCNFTWKDWGPDHYTHKAEGEVVKIVPPRLFSFRWYPIEPEQPTIIRFDLTDEFGGTVVTLTESGYTDSGQSKKMILECSSGWGEALTLLKFYLEHGVVYTQPRRD